MLSRGESALPCGPASDPSLSFSLLHVVRLHVTAPLSGSMIAFRDHHEAGRKEEKKKERALAGSSPYIRSYGRHLYESTMYLFESALYHLSLSISVREKVGQVYPMQPVILTVGVIRRHQKVLATRILRSSSMQRTDRAVREEKQAACEAPLPIFVLLFMGEKAAARGGASKEGRPTPLSDWPVARSFLCGPQFPSVLLLSPHLFPEFRSRA